MKIGNTLYTRKKKDKEVEGDPDVNLYCCRKNPYIWIVIVKGAVVVSYRCHQFRCEKRKSFRTGEPENSGLRRTQLQETTH
jgi:hypothetical protein